MSVITQEIPGLLLGLLRSLFLFRSHGRFFLVFPVTFSFFRHDVYSGQLIGDRQANYYSGEILARTERRSTQTTLILLFAIRPVTFPDVTGIIEVGVLRHLYSDTSLVDLSISAITFPSDAV
jgi:hypothetical protein